MAGTTVFKNHVNVVGYNDFSQYPSTIKYSATLTTSSDTTVTVPGSSGMGRLTMPTTNEFIVVIRCTAAASVWFAVNETAAVPAGSSFATTTSDLITGGEVFSRIVKADDVLHFFTAASNVVVSVVFYSQS